MEQTLSDKNITDAAAMARLDGYNITPDMEVAGYKVSLGTLKASNAAKKFTDGDETAARIFFRLIELIKMRRAREFDLNLLCRIHKSLYNGIIPDAGTLRNCDIIKDNASCISHTLLGASIKAALRQLNRAKLMLMTRKEAAAALCHFCRELLILSPFIKGSELVMRVILKMFCESCGLDLDYSKCGGRLIDAERLCLSSDDVRPLFECYIKALSHRRPSPRVKAVLSPPKKEKSIKKK